MRQHVWLVTTLSAALVAGGCAARMGMSASAHLDRDRDFAAYNTYQWGPADALPTGDPRLDKDPFFQDHMQGAVEKQLAARGLQLAGSATPDLLIHYHANISERIDVYGVDRAYGYCDSADCPSSIIRYEAGTIVLDVIDARTNTLIWRGWAQTNLQDVLGNRARLERVIDEAAVRMLQRFPRPPRPVAAPATK
jgi:Domain of unknown function (DUF4136)